MTRYTLITGTGRVMQFHIRAVADLYQRSEEHTSELQSR